MLPSFYTQVFKQAFKRLNYHLPDSQFPIIKSGIKINFFHSQGAKRIKAEVLGAHTSQCWGSDKDMIFASATLTLLLWWCYPPSLSTQTFRIKSDPKAIMFSDPRNPQFPTRLSSLKVSVPSRDPCGCPLLSPQFAQSWALLFPSRQLMSWAVEEHCGVYVFICTCVQSLNTHPCARLRLGHQQVGCQRGGHSPGSVTGCV